VQGERTPGPVTGQRTLRRPVARSEALVYTAASVTAPAGAGAKELSVKKVVALFAVIGAAVGGLMFWRRRKSDDEFLDEELE
jgi:uncharacterized membrane protein YfcA